MSPPTRIEADYPHLRFHKCWRLTEQTLKNLGRAERLVRCLADLPIDPKVQQELRRVSFQRGAVATTAIEGNTLTQDELRARLAGRELPKSREYQAREVENALQLFDEIWHKIIKTRDLSPIGPKLLCEFNKTIGKELGPLYDGVPGRPRRDSRHVGAYLPPPHEELDYLLRQFCNWLAEEFRLHQKHQSIPEAIIQAIVAHVFFEWIHPFADGNGRTGRALEFYILLRGGMPDVSAHALANHYNRTRNEYYQHFEQARKTRDLTKFLDYAVQGLVDGLDEAWNTVQDSIFKVCWDAHVYRIFAQYTYHKKTIFKRRRDLALAMPLDRDFTLLKLARSSDALARQYMNKDMRALKADFEVVVSLKLAEAVGEGKFRATADILRMQKRVAAVES